MGECLDASSCSSVSATSEAVFSLWMALRVGGMRARGEGLFAVGFKLGVGVRASDCAWLSEGTVRWKARERIVVAAPTRSRARSDVLAIVWRTGRTVLRCICRGRGGLDERRGVELDTLELGWRDGGVDIVTS